MTFEDYCLGAYICVTLGGSLHLYKLGRYFTSGFFGGLGLIALCILFEAV